MRVAPLNQIECPRWSGEIKQHDDLSYPWPDLQVYRQNQRFYRRWQLEQKTEELHFKSEEKYVKLTKGRERRIKNTRLVVSLFIKYPSSIFSKIIRNIITLSMNNLERTPHEDTTGKQGVEINDLFNKLISYDYHGSKSAKKGNELSEDLSKMYETLLWAEKNNPQVLFELFDMQSL